MKHYSSKILVGLAIALAGFTVSAQEFKVGVVNLDRIFREANSAKTAQTKLEQEFSKREKELADLASQLKAQSDKFEREAPTLAESQRIVRQRQLVDQDRIFQTKRREFQEDLSTRKNEELQQVIERANKVVKTLAETEKYDLILQESVYVNPKHDITDKVIKALNAAR
ncbi:periplasmic chaperone for outer membrane proteins Skp [Polaromonas sp. OV174]|uniref:OmpH family outer membrane protein n=1 Tax=Polaromonas sp. OV174 TaxID=1855300 RepID=UPI0008E41852|nr:OmpH family outer membrane protein [Polaromonas sp. OV174]SFB97572.1 periplasmic chaperone for outer membrane proteins Skp [Polaromonas sp. OV174]